MSISIDDLDIDYESLWWDFFNEMETLKTMENDKHLLTPATICVLMESHFEKYKEKASK